MQIVDFGISKDMGYDALNNTTLGGAGTEGWALTSASVPGKEGDVFGLGLTLSYFLTNGDNGFGDERKFNLPAWARGDYKVGKEVCNCISLIETFSFKRAKLDMPLAELFVAQTVVLDPTARISSMQCAHHPLFWDAGQKISFLKTCWEQNQALLSQVVFVFLLIVLVFVSFFLCSWFLREAGSCAFLPFCKLTWEESLDAACQSNCAFAAL